ncbi:MAG: acyltransferase [Candidatus Saccharibacteria bacterium]|nr:acyltransferase [Candidatus Saccharibacteria bacterium]
MSKLVGINSLRFLAIAFIVTYHLCRDFMPGGYLAVEIFLCISGFLVTKKIIKEAKSGKVSYRNFVVSRFFRLFPTLLICVLASLVLGILVNPDILTGARINTLTALTFSTNIAELFAGGSYENTFLPNIFEHTWYLGLLFQFYLLLPLIFKLFLKISSKPREAIRASGIALVVLGISSTILMACYGGFFDMSDRAYFALDSHMAALCFGAAFAVLNYFKPRPPRTVNRLPFVCLAAALASITALVFVAKYDNPLSFIVMTPLMIALTIIALTCIIRLQNNIRERRKTMNVIRVIESFGNLAYGIYLFHWPLYILLPHLLPYDTAPWGYVVINILLSTFCASIVYRLISIKNPLKKFRKRRRISRVMRLTVVGALVLIAGFTLVRSPETSSISEQLNISANYDDKELISQGEQVTDYFNIASILNETVSVFDSHLQKAQNAEVLSAPTGSLAAANANVANVLVIGDSVTLGAKQAIEATIAKSFVDAKENRGIEAARTLLANYGASGRLPSIIIVSLATNQRTITDQILQDIINVAGNNHKFIFVTAYAGPLQPRDTQNSALKNFAAARDNVYIADWWAVSHDNWSLMYADHIHLNPSGRTAYANLLSNVIKGMR